MLATELGPEYGRPLTQEMWAMRQEAKASLRALNKQNALGLNLQQSPLVSANDTAPAQPQQQAPQGGNQ